MKKALFIIAGKNFRDIEYFKPKEILESAGIEIKVASNIKAKEKAIGADGNEVKIDINLEDVKISDFDAIIFIGGPGAIQYLDNKESYRICHEAVSLNKILSAICIAPVILAKAGVLKNKNATVWANDLNKQPIEILTENGAKYLNQAVVVDGNIITANGPVAAEKFGEELKQKLVL